jgi:hypothetical protein
MRRLHTSCRRGEHFLSRSNQVLTLSEGNGSGTSRGLQECTDRQDPDSESTFGT